jgi:hypothetical protein
MLILRARGGGRSGRAYPRENRRAYPQVPAGLAVPRRHPRSNPGQPRCPLRPVPKAVPGTWRPVPKDLFPGQCPPVPTGPVPGAMSPASVPRAPLRSPRVEPAGPGRVSSGSRWISASAQTIASLTSWAVSVLSRSRAPACSRRGAGCPSPRRSPRARPARSRSTARRAARSRCRCRGRGSARGRRRPAAPAGSDEHAVGRLQGDAVDQALAAHLVGRVGLGRRAPSARP